MLIFLFIPILLSISSTLGTFHCEITTETCNGTVIARLSDLSNAHLADASYTNYSYKICCWDDELIISLNTSENATILLEYANYTDGKINAHISFPGVGVYPNKIGIYNESAVIECNFTNETDITYDACLLSASAYLDEQHSNFNLHVGNCSAYPWKLICNLYYKAGTPCTNDSNCYTNICSYDFDEDDGAWCAEYYQCAHNAVLYENGSCIDYHYCYYFDDINRSNWTQDGDLRKEVCSCVITNTTNNFTFWIDASLFENTSEQNPNCCGDDPKEFLIFNNLRDNDYACCLYNSSCVYAAKCYTNQSLLCVGDELMRCSDSIWNETEIMYYYNASILESIFLQFASPELPKTVMYMGFPLNLTNAKAFIFEPKVKGIEVNVEEVKSNKFITTFYNFTVEYPLLLYPILEVWDSNNNVYILSPKCKIYLFPKGGSIRLYKAMTKIQINPFEIQDVKYCTKEVVKKSVDLTDVKVTVWKVGYMNLTKISEKVIGDVNFGDYVIIKPDDYGIEVGPYLIQVTGSYENGFCEGAIQLLYWGLTQE